MVAPKQREPVITLHTAITQRTVVWSDQRLLSKPESCCPFNLSTDKPFALRIEFYARFGLIAAVLLKIQFFYEDTPVE